MFDFRWNKKDAERNYESNAGGIAPRSLILVPATKKTLNTLYPVPYTLYPITLYPVPCSVYPIPCTLYPTLQVVAIFLMPTVCVDLCDLFIDSLIYSIYCLICRLYIYVYVLFCFFVYVIRLSRCVIDIFVISITIFDTYVYRLNCDMLTYSFASNI